MKILFSQWRNYWHRKVMCKIIGHTWMADNKIMDAHKNGADWMNISKIRDYISSDPKWRVVYCRYCGNVHRLDREKEGSDTVDLDKRREKIWDMMDG